MGNFELALGILLWSSLIITLLLFIIVIVKRSWIGMLICALVSIPITWYLSVYSFRLFILIPFIFVVLALLFYRRKNSLRA